MSAQATNDGKCVDLMEFGTSFSDDPYAVFAELREQGPVHFVRLPDGARAWLVLRYADVHAALTDTTLSKDWQHATGRPGPQAIGTNMLISDPPQHTRLRKLVAKEFSARRIEALRLRVQHLADGLLDAIVFKGRADLIDSLALPLSMTVISELLGVPFADREHFHRWFNEVKQTFGTDSDADRVQRAHAQIIAYVDDLIAQKRAEPAHDLLSALIRATDDDAGQLSAGELRATVLLLLTAGHETVVNLIANGILTLLQHPRQLAALRADWSLLPGTIEEILRYEGSLPLSTRRFTTTPLRIGDTVIPGGGQPVLFALASADRDSSRFPSPNEFDIRRNANGHLAFGHGIHYCLGASLARLEGEIAIRSTLERFPDLALETDSVHWCNSHIVRSLRSLPVRWTEDSSPPIGSSG